MINRYIRQLKKNSYVTGAGQIFDLSGSIYHKNIASIFSNRYIDRISYRKEKTSHISMADIDKISLDCNKIANDFSTVTRKSGLWQTITPQKTIVVRARMPLKKITQI